MSPRQSLTTEDARRIAAERWGVDALAAERLPGERDENFVLRGPDGAAWVLKVAPPEATEEEIRLETAALDWLAARDAELPIPRMRAASNAAVVASVGNGSSARFARLVGHLPGRVLADVRPRSPELLRDLGRVLGRLDRALEGFSPPAGRPADFIWDPRNAGRVMSRGLGALSGERRARVQGILDLFEREVEPALGGLPTGVVHADANDHNVLVGPPSESPPGPPTRITGIIDFGDLMQAPRLTEPAVAAAYALLGDEDPLHAAAAVFGGYHEAMPLSEAELGVAWAFVLARLGVSVSMSALRRAAEPDDPYLFVSEAPAWDALGRLADVHPRHAAAVLRSACGYEPCPRSAAVRAWLARSVPRAAVMPPDVMARPLVLDLGASSTELPDPAALQDRALFDRFVFRRLEDENATVGIGRYDEPRTVYAAGHFDHPSGNPLLRRTIHIAVDLFAPAGTPVLAPLDGRVHSFAVNEGLDDYGPTILLEHAPPDGPVFWTLFGHLATESLAGLEPGRAFRRGEEIARLGRLEENGGWPPHLHFQIVTDLMDRKGEFRGVAPAYEGDVWRSFSPDPRLLLELPEGAGAPPVSTLAALAERRHGVLGRNLSVSYRAPLHVVRGWRQHLYDAQGLAHLDCVNNVAHVGHAHPRVVRAAAGQKALLETNTRYLHGLILELAERLRTTLPAPLEVCWFVNSGSEANELALRIARAATGRQDVVVLEGGYHGNTQAMIDVSPYKHAGPGGAGAPPWVHVAAAPDDFRGPYRRNDPACGSRYALHVAAAVARASERNGGPAAFLHETLLSCAGQIEPPPGYLAEAYRVVRAAGGLAIADEVQVGLGRVGTHFWGFETQGVVPDIVTLGKPFGNGHPLGVVVTTRTAAAAFDNGMEYFNTFGGNPASCAAGLAVLDVLAEESLQAHALRVGTHLKEGLAELAGRHPAVGDVRGRGLFLGMELVRDPDTREPDGPLADYLVQRARERGVLLSTDGPDHNVIKVKPPLVFDDPDAERTVRLLDELLSEDFPRSRASG